MLKKLLKKLCVMCTAATLLLSCIGVPSVFAETSETVEEINGWKFIMNSGNDGFHNTFKSDCSVSVSNEWAKDGSNSLKIVYPHKPISAGTGAESGAIFKIILSAQSIGILEPGTYKISYSLRAVDAAGNVLDAEGNQRSLHGGKSKPILSGSDNVTATIGNGKGSVNLTADAVSSGTGTYSGNYTTVARTATISKVYTGTETEEEKKANPTLINCPSRNTAPSASTIDKFFTIEFATPFNKYTGFDVAALYVDDIKLTRDGSNENLLVNGSFEDNDIQPVYGSKAVVADTAVGTNGNIALTWKNPSEPLKSVELFDITDGNETAVNGFAENLEKGAKNSVVLEGVEKKRHYYKVVNTFTDDTVSEFILSANANDNLREGTLVEGWTLKDSKAGYINKTVADIDTNIKHSGNSSLHIRSGRSVYSYSEYLGISQALPALDSHVTNEGYYKMSMWVKKNNSAAFFTRINNQVFPGFRVDGTKSGNNFYLIQLGPNQTAKSHGWQYFEYVFSPAKDTILELNNAWTEGASALNWVISQYDTADDVWIDDLTFVKCDENGKTLDGEQNLITNPGFEFDENTDTVEGFINSDVTLTPSDGAITVSYPEINDGEKVNIYFTENGIKEFKGSLYDDKTEFTFKNLENKKDYEITVAKANAKTGIEQSDAVVKTAAPVPPAAVLGDYVLSNAEGVVTNAKTPGTYSIKLNVRNNTVDDGYRAVLIYAVYDSENKMTDFDFCDKTIAVDENKDLEVKDIVIKEGDVLKVFCWNGFDTIKPLKPFVNFSK